MTIYARFAYVIAPVVLAVSASLAACGGGDDGGGGIPPGQPGADAGGHADVGSILGQGANIASVTVDPPNAAVESLNSASVTQTFTATAHLTDGTTQKLGPDVAWSATNFQLGAIDGKGVYTANGSIGGVSTITAAYKGVSGTAQLTVKLHIVENPGNVPPGPQGGLKGAVNPDASIAWAYPYDGTVFPRGLAGPTLQWNGGAASDFYYVHVTSPTFDLESFATAPPPARLQLADATWQKLVDSTAGDAKVFVSRWDGSKATVIAKDHTWTVAPASMRGTIYYWANNLGRVMRIKPGAAMPDDFANKPPLNDPNQYTQSSCLMTCHTVSADGSTIISGGGTYGGSYDLIGGAPKKSLGGTWGSDGSVIQWMDSALSPDGKYMVVNSMALGLNAASGNPVAGGFNGVYDTAAGARITSGALDGLLTAMPAFAPDGSIVAYVDSGDPTAWGSWINPNPGNLRLVSFNEKANPMATNARNLVDVGADPNKRIGWPSITPDAKSVIYQRGASADTRGGNADLYIASTAAANMETRLAKLDGDGYPFAAGTRDLSWNYEPTFAPVAAGGYFWVVFTSRRTYGNTLTGQPNADGQGFLGTKQLWVAAIDQNPAPGKDPSHPPFRLPGQDVNSVNMRGFWALDPCKGDGKGCMSGTECCGGYCDEGGDGGAPVCRSKTTTCSQNGDRCDMSSDCCNAGSGVTCINHVCSEPPPK